MALDDFTELEFLHKFLLLIFIIISFIIGLKVILKFFKHHRIEFITVGLGWILLTSGWWAITINFILKLFYNSALETNTYLLLDRAFIPIGLVLWIYSFSHLTYPSLEKIITLIFLAICIIFEILFITFLITNPELIGTRISKYEYKHSLFSDGFAFFTIIAAGFAVTLFIKTTLRSENERIKWMGRFLLISFISLAFGAVLNIIWGSVFNFLPMHLLTVIAIRGFLIFSAITFYLGFYLPERLANWLIKDKNKIEE